MNIQSRNIGELVDAMYNPRKDLRQDDGEYKKIKMSIEKFGYVDPIIINSDNTIIGGHQRVKALEELGFTEIDVVIVDLDKGQEKALNVALNKIGGEWDFEKLDILLSELKEIDFDMSLTGFDVSEISDISGMFDVDEQTSPESFREYGEDIETNKKCPKCGYEWS